MTSKANHAKYICGIRDAIQGSSDDTNLPFIIGSLELYEQCYGSQNKENFRKFLNDALSVYGPGTPFENDDRVIPLYILLGKYSRSSTQGEIFDRMNATGAYRGSAKFYTEWAKVFTQAGHATKAKEILSDGIKRKAKPELMLQTALKDLGYSLDENNQPRTIKRPTTTPSLDKNVARKQLFPNGTPARPDVRQVSKQPKQTAAEPAPVKPEDDFVFPALPSYSNYDPSKQDQHSVSQSLIVLPNFSQRENPDDGNKSDSERSEDAENVRPVDAPEEQPIKRRTAGILVPAAGFQLEDYDFYSNDDEDEKKNDKEEANRINIVNNTMPSPSARRPILPSPTARRAILTNDNFSAPSPSRRQLFPVVLPEAVLPPKPEVPSALSAVNTDFTNEFRNGTEALQNLRHDSDSENENEPNRRLTGFERLMHKRKSLVGRQSLAAQKPKVEPLEQLFSRMGVASPGPSKP